MVNSRKYYIISLLMGCILLALQTVLYGQSSLPAVEWRLKQDIYALSHDSMLGRNAGSLYELKAARYISAEFEKAGLQPAGAAGSYLLPFEFGNFRYQKCQFDVNGKVYRHYIDFGATAASADGEIRGEIINCGSGLVIPGMGIDNFANAGNPQGRVALIDLFVPKSIARDTAAVPLTKPSARISEAVRRGALAVILCSSSDGDDPGRLFRPDSLSQFPVPVIYVTRQVAKKLAKMGSPACTINVKIGRKRNTAYNVVGLLDNHAQKTVVIGGHFDHVGVPRNTSAVPGDPGTCNGADDNASGTAGVMELARWASQQENLKCNYLFIAFSAEEKGLLGSMNWCNSQELRKYNIAWMLNLDMIGRLNWNGKNRLIIQGLGSSPAWKKVLNTCKPTAFKVAGVKGAPEYSDHYPFVKHGIPVLAPTSGLHKEYHKPLDDAEKINYSGQAEVLHYLEQIILEAEKMQDIPFRRITGWQNTKALTRELILKI